jgi:hypothetical protein
MKQNYSTMLTNPFIIMKSLYKKINLLLLLLTVITQVSLAATITSVQDGNWGDPATWDNGVPDDDDDVIIDHVVVLDEDTKILNTLTVNSGATLNNPSNKLINTTDLVVDGVVNSCIVGDISYVSVSNGGQIVGLKLSTDPDAYLGNVTIDGGTVGISGTTTTTVSGAVNVIGGGTLNISDDGTRIFAGLLTIGSGSTFNSASGSHQIRIRGGIDNSGTFTKNSTGTMTFQTNTQTVTANSPININAGAVTFASNTTLAGTSAINFNTTSNVTISNNISVTNTNTDSVRIVGTLNGGGSNAQWINQGVLAYENATQPMATGILTATAVGNTVKYTRGGPQTVKNTTYRNLVLANTGNKTIPSTLTVNGNLDVRGSAVLVTPSANTTVTVGGKLRFFNSATATVPASNTLAVNVTDSLIYRSSASTAFANGAASTFTVGTFAQSAGTINLASSNTGKTTINVSGNFSQTGGTITETATQPSNASLITFNDTSTQQISQSGGATILRGDVGNTNYPRFVFNNSNGFTLNTDVEVPAITLTSGKVTTGSNVLKISETEAAAISGGNNNSHINGKIGRKVATTSTVNLEMPVGKANRCRPLLLQVTQAAATPTYYVAEQFESTARNIFNTLPDSILWVSDVRYFNISKSTDVGVNAKVTIRYAIDDYVFAEQGLTICKSNASYTGWDKIRNLTTGSNGCVPTGLGEWDCQIQSDVFNTFSDFVLASGNTQNLLPIRVLSFTGKISNKDVSLDWQTASESNSSHFIVERSINGKDFKEVGRVAAAGNSNSPKSYQLLDVNAAMNKVARLYYRLRLVDLDGTQEFSPVVVVILTPSESLSAEAYPNPFDEQVSINISAQGVENAQVEVTDITGKTITKRIIGLSNGSYNGILNMPTQLSAGVYLMKVVAADGQVKTVKIIKK